MITLAVRDTEERLATRSLVVHAVRDDVAAGEDAGHGRREILVDFDVSALVEREFRRLADDRVRVRSDREHDAVAFDLEVAVPHRHRAAAAGGVSLAELHAPAADRADAMLTVAQDLDRIR